MSCSTATMMIAPPECPNSSQTLPAEILDHIFSYLQKDPVTLRSINNVCLETHSNFLRDILDRHLYAHIVVINFISFIPGLFFYSELFQYLSDNPHVSKYIRTLHIEIEMSRPYDLMSPILRMLRSTLKGITLSSTTPRHSNAAPTRLDWSDLHETFRHAFLECLRSPNLSDASLDRVKGVPLSIFNDCTMQKVSLRRVKVSSSPFVQFPPQTTSLTLDDTSSEESATRIRDWARAGPNLRSLNFSSDSQISFYFFLMELSTESLTDLGLDFGNLFMTSYPPSDIKLKRNLNLNLHLSRLPTLKELTIKASISWSSQSWIESAIPSIAQVASTSPSLQRLILRIKIKPRCAGAIANPEIWEPLVSLTARPSLEQIELGLISGSSKGRRIPGIISKLLRVSQLKKMHKDGFLSLEEVDE